MPKDTSNNCSINQLIFIKVLELHKQEDLTGRTMEGKQLGSRDKRKPNGGFTIKSMERRGYKLNFPILGIKICLLLLQCSNCLWYRLRDKTQMLFIVQFNNPGFSITIIMDSSVGFLLGLPTSYLSNFLGY